MKHLHKPSRARRRSRGVSIVPVMLIVSALAIFTMALTAATLSGNKSMKVQAEDYHLSSAVESAAILAMEDLWSRYLAHLNNNGLPQTIVHFRTFLSSLNVLDQSADFDPDNDGVIEEVPDATDGLNLLSIVNLPERNGKEQFNDVNLDALQIVRVDVTEDATQLFLTVSASTTKGDGLVNPVMNRAVQQVYTVEPDDFAGFDYAMLANNINCIFCHTSVDSAERYWNTDPALESTFPRIKVGSLESLMIRHDMNGIATGIDDYDADSFVAGTVYTRGLAALHDGASVGNWADLSFQGYEFAAGQDPGDWWIHETSFGLNTQPFAPGSLPLAAGENLYVDYPALYGDQVDGPLPDYFPAPIPDDGGRNPITGLPDLAVSGNRQIDDIEFETVARKATGAITAGIVDVTPHGSQITSINQYAQSLFSGNATSIQQSQVGNVVLTGTELNPIRINGTVAIDGDLIIQGWVAGEGTLLVRGNVYVPTDLVYLDGVDSNGNRTFGTNAGQSNALGLAAGGNILIGDFQRPASLKPDWSYSIPGPNDIVSGNPDTGVLMTDEWSFPLAEMGIFNRGEWSKTQALLPAFGDDISDPSTWTAVNEDSRTHEFLPAPGQNLQQPSTWTRPNPKYDPAFQPRYYAYGDDTIIPIQNRSDSTMPDPLDPSAGHLYFDPTLKAWVGDETSLGWDTSKLTYADPTDPSDPLLYDSFGDPVALVSQLSHGDDWIDPAVYQTAMEYFHDNRGALDLQPMHIDGLLYTNNAIFSIVNRSSNFKGRMLMNGSLVAADLGMLVPGHKNQNWVNGWHQSSHPDSTYAVGLQLNYDLRVKDLLNVTNPQRVKLKRTLWNPTANIF